MSTETTDPTDPRRLADALPSGEYVYVPGNGIGMRHSSFEPVQDPELGPAYGGWIAFALTNARELAAARVSLTQAQADTKAEALQEALNQAQRGHASEVVHWLAAYIAEQSGIAGRAAALLAQPEPAEGIETWPATLSWDGRQHAARLGQPEPAEEGNQPKESSNGN